LARSWLIDVWRTKSFPQHLATELENLLDVGAHPPAMHQPVKRDGVTDVVAGARAAVARLEGVCS
jgi:hypothetical protein